MIKKWCIIISLLILLWLCCASTPTVALRTHLLLLGYPTSAMQSEFIKQENSALYKLTQPPIEKATQGTLTTFIVHQYGFIYIAKY